VGMGVPMRMGFPKFHGIPTEWELDLSKDGNGNTKTWEWERLMLMVPNHSRGSVKSHYATLCDLGLRLSHKGP